jgi:hypothetical protein
MKTLQKMKVGNPVPFTEFTLLLPETGNHFTITCHSFSPINSVSVLGGFQQVPKLASEKRAVTIVGQPSIWNFLLVGPTLTL